MSVDSTPEGRRYVVIDAAASHSGGALEPITLFKTDGTAYAIPQKQAAQADTTAVDLAALKVDFNLLLAKLRLAKIIS